MTNNLSLLIKKYSVPALFIVLAIGMFYITVSSKQNSTFIMATVMMFVAGILTLLYSSGKISTKVLTILGGIAFLGAAYTLYDSASSVGATVVHREQYALTIGKSQLNLSDIRTAQKAYLEENGFYAATWDDLIDFIKNGKVPFVDMEGTVPGRRITTSERAILYGDNRAIDVNMTEAEALKLALSSNPPEDLKTFRRDTIMVSFLKSKFETSSYKEAREVAGYGPFSADSLPFIPGTQKKWQMKTIKKLKIQEQYFPAFKVWGKLPYAEIEGTDPKEISLGSLTTNDTGGSWEQ
jgi:hypothetical protein